MRSRRSQVPPLLVCGVALFVSGCVTRGERPTLATPVPAAWANGPTERGSGATLIDWWKRYRDTHLSSVVDRALGSNPTIQEARQRLIAARALARAENALRFPGVGATAGAEITSRLAGDPAGLNAAGEDRGQGPRRTVGVATGGFEAAWEIDLFGRLAAQVNAAERAADASREDMEAIRITLAAEVVRAYVELRGAQNRRNVHLADIEARRRLLSLVQEQKAAGAAGDFDVQRAEATYQTVRALLPPADQAVTAALQRLATLSGASTPDRGLLRSRGAYPILGAPAARTPANVVRARPDIRRAEQLVLQRAALADVAFADLFPRLVLGGTLDIRTSIIGVPIAGTPITVTGGPGISLPLFDWGQRRAIVSARDAELQEAIAAYRRIVLNAVEEIEVSLSAVRQAAMRVERLKVAVAASRRASASADRLYRAGQTGLTERLQAETDLWQTELALAIAREDQGVVVVALHKALGAGPTRLPIEAPPNSAWPSPSSWRLGGADNPTSTRD